MTKKAKNAEVVNPKSLDEQASEILKRAEEKGLNTNFFFANTFDQYLVQRRIMRELDEAMRENGTLVSKEYVKGRANIYTNPAIAEYNRTATAANGTVITLLKILGAFANENETPKQSKLAAMMADE